MFNRPKNCVFFASGGSVTTGTISSEGGTAYKIEGFLILWVAIFDFERLSAVGSWPVHECRYRNYPRLWLVEPNSLAVVGIFSTRSRA